MNQRFKIENKKDRLAWLKSGNLAYYVRCTDCLNWVNKCTAGYTPSCPDIDVHMCGKYRDKLDRPEFARFNPEILKAAQQAVDNLEKKVAA